MKKKKTFLFVFLILICASINIIILVGSAYYIFKSQEYRTIIFNSNGGTLIESQTVESGTIVELPAEPIKLGFKFAGWKLNNEFINTPITVDKNIELVAKWEAIKINTYAVKFYNEDGTLYSRQLVKENTLAFSPKKPKKSGFTFEYWIYNGEKFDFSTRITKDIELYPIFKEKVEENYDHIIDEGYDQEIIDD